MVKRYKIVIVAVLLNLTCLNVSQAQQAAPPAGGTLGPSPAPSPVAPQTPTPAQAPSLPAPAPAVTPPTAAPAATVPATNGGAATNILSQPGAVNPNAILNLDKVTTGKFAEHMSICRSREFDKIQYRSQELLQAKLKELDGKTEALLAAESIDPRQAFVLLNDLLEYDSMTNFDQLVSNLRLRKLGATDTHRLNAYAAYSKHNYREAITHFQSVIDEEKGGIDEFSLRVMAEIYAKESNYYEAATIYEDLNKLRKDRYLRELCESMVLNSLNADGESTCLSAATKYPSDPFPLIYAGITYRERENLKRARDLFRRANNIKATEMGNVCIAELSLMENKIDDAVKYFKLSVAQSPRSARAVLGLAWAQIKALNFDEALGTFKQACRLNPKYEVEVRKAYKKLTEDKVPDAERFMKLATSCQ